MCDKRPLTFPLVFVAVTLTLDGIISIVFADWLHSVGYPTGESMLEVIVQIVIGFSLLLNMVFGRFLSLLYCFLSFFGVLVFFSYQKMLNPSFRNITIFHFIYFAMCTAILAMDWLKNRKIDR